MARDEGDRRGRFIIMISFPSASAAISYGTIDKYHVGFFESHPPSENDFRNWSFQSEDPTDLITDLLTQQMKSMVNNKALLNHDCRQAVVLCYPNAWSESHRQTMSFCIRKALVAAEVPQTEDTRDLCIFPESEICLMYDLTMKSSLMSGDVFIHLYAGNGILDVYTYKVDYDYPLLLSRMSSQPRSRSRISTCLDRRFRSRFTIKEQEYLDSLKLAIQDGIESAIESDDLTTERLSRPAIPRQRKAFQVIVLTGEYEKVEALTEYVLEKLDNIRLLTPRLQTTRSEALFEGAAHLVANKDEWYRRDPYGTG
ncbi:hypothetical protein AU210_016400 [Fusarium oxysporum f. sp. radicis-cucumerinum]|uniref:Uncharacterized protein n=1 Tax=Fusarium oxysporum f. sp. radicis-cucumerinum TaxID=327505 RepID=A0A2H3FP94_FUSOX|nr:hypothetical protein AU210_016400 [Fusarium oxysporum f. sp. radicis-cucumerinum]